MVIKIKIFLKFHKHFRKGCEILKTSYWRVMKIWGARLKIMGKESGNPQDRIPPSFFQNYEKFSKFHCLKLSIFHNLRTSSSVQEVAPKTPLPKWTVYIKNVIFPGSSNVYTPPTSTNGAPDFRKQPPWTEIRKIGVA